MCISFFPKKKDFSIHVFLKRQIDNSWRLDLSEKKSCTKCLIDIFTIVCFLVLVTTMVTKVDHSYHSTSNHRGYYDGYNNVTTSDGNTFFCQRIYLFRRFLRFSIIFHSFHTQQSSDFAKFWAINEEIMYYHHSNHRSNHT